MPDYRVLMHRDALKKAEGYLAALKAERKPGKYLQAQINAADLATVTTDAFVEMLMRTKVPKIFAESAVFGDGRDWNLTELSILGDISIATTVTIFDNGLHKHPQIHQPPFEGTLLFTPGALLQNGKLLPPADEAEVTANRQINFEGYYRLYERRLLPVFLYADAMAKEKGKSAFITIPGLGCGMFAGWYQGTLGVILQNTLTRFLENHGKQFSHIKVVYYDPYSECQDERTELHGISFFVRPLTKGNENKPQLCKPEMFAETGDFFTYYELFSIVAWDHVSWPGNDFYVGDRQTDDGVKAAATNSMQVMTGIQGEYEKSSFQYRPPKEYADWNEVIQRNNLQLSVQGQLQVFP